MADATIRDVAQQAHLSVASVSRALNGHKSVRPETRARVIAVADALGYVPHAGARSLSMARSNAIGVVLSDLHGAFFSEIVRGMNREASRLGRQLLLSNMHADPAQAAQALRAMHGRVDGLLIVSPQMRAEGWTGAIPRGLPVVLINSPECATDHPTLGVDNRSGAETMTRHLIEIGRRRIAHIAGPDHNIDARERRESFEATMAELLPGEPIRIRQGDFSEASGEAAARHILAERMPVDAIFAGNDMMAIGCLQVLRGNGVPVPRDIAVAGFDDVPVARYLGLTTMRVRIAEIGARAVIRLVERMEGAPRDKAPVELHVPELVTRETTSSIAS
jgi:LacI family transcriptional regulator